MEVIILLIGLLALCGLGFVCWLLCNKVEELKFKFSEINIPEIPLPPEQKDYEKYFWHLDSKLDQRNSDVHFQQIQSSVSTLQNGVTRAENSIAHLFSQLDKLSHLEHSQTHLEQIGYISHMLNDLGQEISDLKASFTGSSRKGATMEHLISSILAALPNEIVSKNLRIGGGQVEFAIKLSNNLYLPIDSKAVATEQIEEFAQNPSPQLKKSIESSILNKATEITKYLNSELTENFGIMVVPQNIEDFLNNSAAKFEAFKKGVHICSYGNLLSTILIFYRFAEKTSGQVDSQKALAQIQGFSSTIQELSDEIEGRFSKFITMAQNSQSDMRKKLSKLKVSID